MHLVNRNAMANRLKPVVLTLFDGNKFSIVAKTVLSSHWLTWMDLNIRYSLNRWDQVVKRHEKFANKKRPN